MRFIRNKKIEDLKKEVVYNNLINLGTIKEEKLFEILNSSRVGLKGSNEKRLEEENQIKQEKNLRLWLLQ